MVGGNEVPPNNVIDAGNRFGRSSEANSGADEQGDALAWLAREPGQRAGAARLFIGQLPELARGDAALRVRRFLAMKPHASLTEVREVIAPTIEYDL